MIPKELLAQYNIHIFNEIYGITNDQGAKLDFSNHAFMWDIFSDFTPKQAGRKAAQITWSTMASIKTLWLAKNKGLDIIYTLPTADDARNFVKGKVNRLIQNNPVFQSWTEDSDSVEQKKVGKNIIYYKGTISKSAPIATPADLYVSDETDRSDLEAVEKYSSRLQHSQFKWEWRFSNPSAPGVGVDKWWELSDQKHWFVKCDGCNKEQFLTMENVINEPPREPYFGCTKCKKELNRRVGRWVKRWQDKEISGYWVSLLIAPWVSAKEILKLQKTKPEDQFANFVLGIPYIGKGNVLTQNLLFQNLTKRINPQDGRILIGVDTGVDIRYTVGNKHGLFYYSECKDYSELEKLLNRWPNSIMVIDQGGDIIGPRKLREKYPNRVYLCFFRQDRKNDRLIEWDDSDGTVVADRNKLIQLVVDEFTEKRIPIFGTEAEWWDYWLHWSHMYRISEENALGVTQHKWMRSDRDDWALATVYWRIAMDRFLESYATFAEPKGQDFAAKGIEVLPDNETFLPIWRKVSE